MRFGIKSCGFRPENFYSGKTLEVAIEVLLRGNDEQMHNLVSEARSRGYLVTLKCSEILLLRDTTMLLRFDTTWKLIMVLFPYNCWRSAKRDYLLTVFLKSIIELLLFDLHFHGSNSSRISRLQVTC